MEEVEPPTKRVKLDNTKDKKPRRIKKRPVKPPKPGSSDSTITFSLRDLFGDDVYEVLLAGEDAESPFERFTEVEVEVKALTSHGDGLALADDQPRWAVVVPYCLPGERVLARVHRHDRLHSHADLVRVLRPTGEDARLDRDDSRVGCQYFGKCSGCQVRPSSRSAAGLADRAAQYQMLSYEKQLEVRALATSEWT